MDQSNSHDKNINMASNQRKLRKLKLLWKLNVLIKYDKKQLLYADKTNTNQISTNITCAGNGWNAMTELNRNRR